MTETNVNPDDNLDDEGQVEGKQGQAGGASASGDSQLEGDLVELPDGEKVTLEELKKGYMKDADYRQKTADVATEKARAEAVLAEREAERVRQENLGRGGESEEEISPLQIIDDRLTRMEMLNARTYLTSEIDRLTKEYPEADKKSVYDACWNNPNAVIKDEMDRSHKNINERIAKKGTSIDTLLKEDPEAEKKLKEKHIAEYNASKKLKADAGTGTGAGSGETVIEGEKPVKDYKEAGKNLRDKLAAQDSADL